MIVSEATSAWEPDRYARTWAAAREARVQARSLHARSVLLRAKLADARNELHEALMCQARIVRALTSTPRVADLRARDDTCLQYGFSLPLPAAAQLTDADLAVVTNDVIVAYRTAVHECDDDAILIFADVLREIGRNLAEQVGPKAAGVLLS